jgi:hypothetical protein
MVTKTAGVVLPESGFFIDGLSNEGMHVPDRVTKSFGACELTDRVVRALSSKLIGNERAGVIARV